MSLRYLLDGYNIVHQLKNLYLKELEEQRKGLVRFIEIQQPQGSIKNSVTIIFDGQDGYGDQQYSSIVKVIFSKGESADCLIKKMVAKSNNKKRIIVVSNDREIQCFIAALGAQACSVQNFLNQVKSVKIKMKQRGSEENRKEDAKRISKELEYKITSELSDIWVKKRKKT